MDNVFIVIPAYNEEKHIEQVIKETKKDYKNIVVVDDGSKDKTGVKAGKAGAQVLTHIINLGKGAATKTGCDYAAKQGAKTIVLMDSDGQHKPGDIPRILNALEGNDIVFTYRKRTKEMPVVMKLGNWFLSTSTTILFGLKIKDTQSGFRAFTSQAYKKIRWESTDYTMESEMITKAAKHKLKYGEISIKTIYHDRFKGTSAWDGVTIFLNTLKFRLRGK